MSPPARTGGFIEPVPGSIWRHYNNNLLYRVVSVSQAKNIDGLDEWTHLVTYKEYSQFNEGTTMLYTRTRENFYDSFDLEMAAST